MVEWLTLITLPLENTQMRNLGSTTQDEISSMETAPDRKVVQISTMVHAEKDWAFVALCDDGSL